jgi:hypothetical protein
MNFGKKKFAKKNWVQSINVIKIQTANRSVPRVLVSFLSSRGLLATRPVGACRARAKRNEQKFAMCPLRSNSTQLKFFNTSLLHIIQHTHSTLPLQNNCHV